MSTYKFETTIEVENEDLDITVEFDVLPEEKQTFDSPGYPTSIEIIKITDSETKEKIPEEGFNKKQIQSIEEEAFAYLNSTTKDKANLADDKVREMEESKMSSEMTFASAGEAIQHLADKLGKKVVIAAEKEVKKEEVNLKEVMIDKTHRLVLVDEGDGKYKVKIYEITDAGSDIVKEFGFSRLEQAQGKFEEMLPKEETEEEEESEEESLEESEEENESEKEEEGEGKMAEDLMFTSSDEALQHLANLTGKKIIVAGNKSTFPCPICGTKVLENTKYCVKCKKKVEMK